MQLNHDKVIPACLSSRNHQSNLLIYSLSTEPYNPGLQIEENRDGKAIGVYSPLTNQEDDVGVAERCTQWTLDKLPSCGRGEGLTRTTFFWNIDEAVITSVYNG